MPPHVPPVARAEILAVLLEQYGLAASGLVPWQLTAHGGLQLGREDERAGSASVTLAVDDIEAHVAELAEREVAIGEIVQGTGASFAIVHDPEGNRIVVASMLRGG